MTVKISHKTVKQRHEEKECKTTNVFASQSICWITTRYCINFYHGYLTKDKHYPIWLRLQRKLFHSLIFFHVNVFLGGKQKCFVLTHKCPPVNVELKEGLGGGRDKEEIQKN